MNPYGSNAPPLTHLLTAGPQDKIVAVSHVPHRILHDLKFQLNALGHPVSPYKGAIYLCSANSPISTLAKFHYAKDSDITVLPLKPTELCSQFKESADSLLLTGRSIQTNREHLPQIFHEANLALRPGGNFILAYENLTTDHLLPASIEAYREAFTHTVTKTKFHVDDRHNGHTPPLTPSFNLEPRSEVDLSPDRLTLLASTSGFKIKQLRDYETHDHLYSPDILARHFDKYFRKIIQENKLCSSDDSPSLDEFLNQVYQQFKRDIPRLQSLPESTYYQSRLEKTS